MVRADILNYMPLKEVAEKFDLDDEQIGEIAEPFLRERAEVLVSKLEDLDDSFPTLVKEAIWKLQVLVHTAKRMPIKELRDSSIVEGIVNYAIKARLEDYSTWSNPDYSGGLEIAVISNESKLSADWVMLAEKSSLLDLEKEAKRMGDRVTLKDSIKEVQAMSQEHIDLCNEHKLDPRDYTASELKEHIESLEWLNNLGGE